MLSEINGDLCWRGKAFDFTQSEENRLSVFYFSQIHCLFSSLLQILRTTYIAEELFICTEIHGAKKAHLTMKELNGFIVQRK